jgi:hypothetical protein
MDTALEPAEHSTRRDDEILAELRTIRRKIGVLTWLAVIMAAMVVVYPLLLLGATLWSAVGAP